MDVGAWLCPESARRLRNENCWTITLLALLAKDFLLRFARGGVGSWRLVREDSGVAVVERLERNEPVSDSGDTGAARNG